MPANRQDSLLTCLAPGAIATSGDVVALESCHVGSRSTENERSDIALYTPGPETRPPANSGRGVLVPRHAGV